MLQQNCSLNLYLKNGPKWLACGAWVCENWPNAALKKDERHIMMTPMKHWDIIHVNLFPGNFIEPATVADNTSDLRFCGTKRWIIPALYGVPNGWQRVAYAPSHIPKVRGGFRGFVLFHYCSGEMIQFDEHNLSKEWRSRQLAQGLNTNFCKMLLRKNKSKMMLHYMYCKIYGASDKGCVTVMSWSKTLELYRITVAGQDECWNVNFTYGEVTET